MTRYIKCVMVTCLIALVESRQNYSRDSIAYPEVEENLKQRNEDNRSPLFAPSVCPENELYYPGDQKDDWICDCRPSYIFHTKSNMCWPAYQRGPCEAGYYLILVPNSVIPECVRNPCGTDKLVTFRGRCEKLGATTPCTNKFPTEVLSVNATTLTVECTRVVIESYMSEDLQAPAKLCPPGCKRVVQNKCIP